MEKIKQQQETGATTELPCPAQEDPAAWDKLSEEDKSTLSACVDETGKVDRRLFEEANASRKLWRKWVYARDEAKNDRKFPAWCDADKQNPKRKKESDYRCAHWELADFIESEPPKMWPPKSGNVLDLLVSEGKSQAVKLKEFLADVDHRITPEKWHENPKQAINNYLETAFITGLTPDASVVGGLMDRLKEHTRRIDVVGLSGKIPEKAQETANARAERRGEPVDEEDDYEDLRVRLSRMVGGYIGECLKVLWPNCVDHFAKKQDLGAQQFYYLDVKKTFAYQDSDGTWRQQSAALLHAMCAVNGLSLKRDGKASETDLFVHNIMMNHCASAMGQYAGWRTGCHVVSGKKMLIENTYALIEPSESNPQDNIDNSSLISSIIFNSLGEGAGVRLCAYLKRDYLQLKRYADGQFDGQFDQGQAVFLVGERGTGKTFLLHNIIAPILGGRVGQPGKYLLGETPFNDDVFAKEVQIIDDEKPRDSQFARKLLGGAIKQFVAAGTEFCHPKGVAGMSVPLWRRLFVGVNSQDVHALPIMDDSLADKISFFDFKKAALPEGFTWPTTSEEKTVFRAEVRRQLPHFIRWLIDTDLQAVYPEVENIYGGRFDVQTYQDEGIMEKIAEAAPERELEAIIQEFVHGETRGARLPDNHWVSPTTLYSKLLDSQWRTSLEKRCSSPGGLGMVLSAWAEVAPAEIIKKEVSAGSLYQVLSSQPSNDEIEAATVVVRPAPKK